MSAKSQTPAGRTEVKGPDKALGRDSFFSPYEPLVWLGLWTAYFLWAFLAPLSGGISGSEGCLPAIALGVTGLMLLFFLLAFSDRKTSPRLGLWTFNTFVAMTAVPLFTGLNIYRALTDRLPETWAPSEAGFASSWVAFLGYQIIMLVLSVLHAEYTWKQWKDAPLVVKWKGIRRIFFILALLAVFLIGFALFFLMPGFFQRMMGSA